MSTINLNVEAGLPSQSIGEELLVFTLGEEEYGIDILKVQEIRGYDAVTRIAHAPDYMKGVINLRGSIVPILDLRIKFNLGDAVYNSFTVVIVLNVVGRTIGVVVDGVSDVIELSQGMIKPPPDLGATVDTAYLHGLGTVGDRMIIVLDIETLMSSDEIALIDRTSGVGVG